MHEHKISCQPNSIAAPTASWPSDHISLNRKSNTSIAGGGNLIVLVLSPYHELHDVMTWNADKTRALIVQLNANCFCMMSRALEKNKNNTIQ